MACEAGLAGVASSLCNLQLPLPRFHIVQWSPAPLAAYCSSAGPTSGALLPPLPPRESPPGIRVISRTQSDCTSLQSTSLDYLI